ncbi:unnamed protein product [Symbiodinium microadriaticum]|nr:unnamed protein product [Symbiodinium microadriaticum]
MCNVLHDPFVRASASRVQELIQEFEIGNYGKTLLCSVGIVKGELDCDGHFILEDGMATVLALKTLQERYVREKEQALAAAEYSTWMPTRGGACQHACRGFQIASMGGL